MSDLASRLAVRRFLCVLALITAPSLFATTHGDLRLHLALRRAQPAVDDTIAASPGILKLWFTESVGARTTWVRLMNAKKDVVKTTEVSVDAAPLSPAVVTVREKLRLGTYTVMWRAVADDGDTSSGKFSFTIK